jgi:hypothetical protein
MKYRQGFVIANQCLAYLCRRVGEEMDKGLPVEQATLAIRRMLGHIGQPDECVELLQSMQSLARIESLLNAEGETLHSEFRQSLAECARDLEAKAEWAKTQGDD